MKEFCAKVERKKREASVDQRKVVVGGERAGRKRNGFEGRI